MYLKSFNHLIEVLPFEFIENNWGMLWLFLAQELGVLPFSFPNKVAEGQKIFVTCTPANEGGAVKAKWYRNGSDITENERIKITDYTDFSTLVINPVFGHDSGNYTCTLSQDHKMASYTSVLVVQGVWEQ